MEIRKIPGTLDFYAREDGVILDANLNPRKTSINREGYVRVSVKVLSGDYITLGVHRLVALAFIKCPGDVNDYSVNHKDLNKENNNACNLEWLSCGDNNLHSALLTTEGENRFILIGYGKVIGFSNINKVAEFLNTGVFEIYQAILHDKHINNHYIKYQRSKDQVLIPRPKINLERRTFGKGGGYQPIQIKCFDVLEKIEILFDSYYDAARFFDVSPSHIFQCITTDKVKLFKRKYIVLNNHHKEPPALSKKEYERLLGPTGKTVFVKNVITGKEYVFDSAYKFIAEFKLSKKAVTAALSSNKIRNIDNMIFSYHCSDVQ